MTILDHHFPLFVYSSNKHDLPDYYLDGIIYLDDCIVVGQGGLIEYLKGTKNDIDKAADGRFLLFYKINLRHIICTDCTGQDCLYYYKTDNYWAFSNSFLLLVEHLSSNNIRLSLNDGMFMNFGLQHSFGDSLMTSKTVINQIKILPMDMQISVEDNKMSINDRNKRPLTHDISIDNINKTINKFIAKWTSIICALSENLPIGSIRVDVSGGLDSRTILALFIKSGIDLDKIDFISNSNLVDDYRVAELLAKEYHFKLNTKLSNTYLNGLPLFSLDNRYQFFKYGSLGVYHPTYLPSRFRPQLFHFGGHCGESLRLYFPEPIDIFYNRLKRHFPSERIYNRCRVEILETLESDGLLGSDTSSQIKLYQNSRARMHFGRNWYKSFFYQMITPFASSDLYELALSLNEEQSRNRIILALILNKVDKKLCEIPFDRPDKTIVTDYNFKYLDSECLLTAYQKDLKVYYDPNFMAINIQQEKVHTHSQNDIFDLFERELKSAAGSKDVQSFFSMSDINKAFYEMHNKPTLATAFRSTNHIILLKSLIDIGVEVLTPD